ncbi:MAG: radical SAM protein [Thermodesulfobacteriota bacterium]
MLPWKWLNTLLKPRWDWIQVEVTTCCNASCFYCPRTVYRDRWPNRHLSLETFKRLLPAFSQTGLVYLQGWGEPLLNPDFFAMAALAKTAGCRVGTTTNGMLLDIPRMERLVAMEVEVVALSLAGTDEKNDQLRSGTSLEQVLAALKSFKEVKERYGRLKPEIHLAYMLLRSGWPDLGRLPRLLEGLGVSQVVVSTLDFVAHRDLAGEAIRPRDRAEYMEMEARLQAVAAEGEVRGVKIHYDLPEPDSRPRTCPENPTRGLVVAADGGVSPCVFANLPPGATFFAAGQELPYQPLSFGNINELPLEFVWNSKAYAAFRSAFKKVGIPTSCRHCLKI